MSASISHEHDNVYRLDIGGVLGKSDLDRCQEVLLAGMTRDNSATIRLLVVLDNFEGWDPKSNWSDLTFYVRHGGRIERIAIVGDERWRSYAMMFAAADLRKGPVEYFTPDAGAEARAWLSR